MYPFILELICKKMHLILGLYVRFLLRLQCFSILCKYKTQVDNKWVGGGVGTVQLLMFNQLNYINGLVII